MFQRGKTKGCSIKSEQGACWQNGVKTIQKVQATETKVSAVESKPQTHNKRVNIGEAFRLY